MHSRCMQHRMGVWPHTPRNTSRANTALGAWPYNTGSGFLGLWPFSSGSGFGGKPIERVSAALFANVVTKVPTLQKALITANKSYIPNFIRDYMKENQASGKVYSQAEYYSYWEPKFISFGYPKDVLPTLFGEFRKLHAKGLVPREIWNPHRYGTQMPPAASGDPDATIISSNSQFMSYLPWIAGGGLLLVAVGMKKRRKRA